MNQDVGSIYIRENFEPDDRLAVVLITMRADSVIQHLASAETVVKPDFQAWLAHQNAQRSDENECWRHPPRPLKFDESGTAAVEALLACADRLGVERVKRITSPRPNAVHLRSRDSDEQRPRATKTFWSIHVAVPPVNRTSV